MKPLRVLWKSIELEMKCFIFRCYETISDYIPIYSEFRYENSLR